MAQPQKGTPAGHFIAFCTGLGCLFLVLIALKDSLAANDVVICKVHCINGFPAVVAILILLVVGVYLVATGKKGMQEAGRDA